MQQPSFHRSTRRFAHPAIPACVLASLLSASAIAGMPMLTAIPAAAQVVIGASGPIPGFATVTFNSWFGQQFTVGSAPLLINGATAALSGVNLNASEFPEARIYTNSAENTPETLVATLGYIGGGTSPSPTTATFGGSASLLANTTYFFVLRNAGSNGYDWHYSSAGTNTGSDGTVNDLFAGTPDAGATWLNNPGNSGFDPQLFTLSGASINAPTAAPEPVAVALFGTALAPVIGAVVRGRRKSRQP
jgi:hypothetical protein